jgi:hypothetical protein
MKFYPNCWINRKVKRLFLQVRHIRLFHRFTIKGFDIHSKVFVLYHCFVYCYNTRHRPWLYIHNKSNLRRTHLYLTKSILGKSYVTEEWTNCLHLVTLNTHALICFNCYNKDMNYFLIIHYMKWTKTAVCIFIKCNSDCM